MAQLSIQHLNFRYPDAEHLTLTDISLCIEQGKFVTICGPSGSGKSTLLRQLKRELRPAGERAGAILFNNRELDTYPLSELAKKIGMVMQDPEQQMVVDDVLHELVFGMENLGFRTDEMQRRAAEVTSLFGMEAWIHKQVHELSGGQKQTLNLAAIMMIQPELLLLDEPTAQLDPIAAKEFLQHVWRLNEEFGMTILMVEHRLEDVLTRSDRIIYMEDGRIRWDGPTREVLHSLWQHHTEELPLQRYVPSVPALFLRYQEHLAIQRSQPMEMPLTVREGKLWSDKLSFRYQMRNAGTGAVPAYSDRALLHCKELFFQYEADEPLVLNHCSLTCYEHEFLALLGGNGSGKTTLLKVIAGILQPQRGQLYFRGERLKKKRSADQVKIGYLAQNPMLYFAHETVIDELLHAALGIPDRQGRVDRLIEEFGLERLLSQHPYDLSGGEKQKVALACVLLAEPELILLDEPTKGLDPIAKVELGGHLRRLSQAGKTLLLVTHDVEFAATYATSCALMFNGMVTADGDPQSFFGDSLFYTTVINRLLRAKLPKALVVEDIGFGERSMQMGKENHEKVDVSS